MAAIDKIYVSNWEQYSQFKEWCKKQPPLIDKYGKSVPLTKYLFNWPKGDWMGRPIFSAPYYVDAYLIKNCPFDFIQEELMLNYGHWTQEKIDEAYKMVTNRKEENKYFYTWLTPDDFKIVNGVVTMPKLEKSDYEKIKDGELYNSPFTNNKYTVGKHFKCIKHPLNYFNRPFKQKNWMIDLFLPDDLGYMWYHDNHNSWDFSDEFVISKWSSSVAFCKTIKTLKRLMIKWELPVGTIVRVTGKYIFDTYEFKITK